MYGIAGPKTEQFALGSIFWYLSRGKGLFHELDGFDKVNRLSERQFPALRDDSVDGIIGNCWSGKYNRIADLRSEIETLAAMQDMPIPSVDQMSDVEYLVKRHLCEQCYSLLVQDEDSQTSNWWARVIKLARHMKRGLEQLDSTQSALTIMVAVDAALALIARF